MHKNATKYNAIKFLANIYDYNLVDIICFGNDYNDIEMIKNCGKGIVVNNALKEIKEYADDVCDNNNSEGVAKWLSRLL